MRRSMLSRPLVRALLGALMVLLILSVILVPRRPPSRVALLSADEPLLYLRDGAIWVADLAAARANGEVIGQALTLPVAGQVLEAALSPDGQRVAYLLTPKTALAQAPLPAQVWLADLATGESRALSEELEQRSQLTWSPDGLLLALIEDGRLTVMECQQGAQVGALSDLASDGLVYTGYAWLADGEGLVAIVQDETGAQRLALVGGASGTVLTAPLDEAVAAVALTPQGAAATLLTASGALWAVPLSTAIPAPLVAGEAAIAAFAWSAADEALRLAYADRAGALWLATADSDGALATPQQVATLPAPVSALAWLDAETMAATLVLGGGTAVLVVDVATGDTLTIGVAEAITPQAAPEAFVGMLAEVSASYDWYRYQGATESGACASVNCGPTSVAMAIQFARDNLVVPISEIRTYVSGAVCDGTNSTQLRAALTNWGVSYRNIYGLSAVREAIETNGHIVLVPVIMGAISPGLDYEVYNSNPALNYGRYYKYSSGHWLVVRGITSDGAWVKVYDPNVWASGKYYYSDGTPKGKDRLYSYSEFATAFAQNSNWAIEITMAPSATSPTAVPTATATPTATAVLTAAPTATFTPAATATPAATPTPSSIPAAPAGLTASEGAYADCVRVGWDVVAGATFNTVHRAEEGGSRVYLANAAAPPVGRCLGRERGAL